MRRMTVFETRKRLDTLPGPVAASRRFERCHVDHEAILYVALEQALVSLVDVLNRDGFDLGSDPTLTAEIEHFLGFSDAADGAARKAPRNPRNARFLR